MRHLFITTGHIERLHRTLVRGTAQLQWVPVDDPKLQHIKCRLDLNYLRPGKDQPPPFEAGRAPDRMGLLICDILPIRAGDRFVCDSGPVQGTFEIRAMPDVTITGRPVGHHLEMQVVETNQNLPSPT